MLFDLPAGNSHTKAQVIILISILAKGKGRKSDKPCTSHHMLYQVTY
jgi:hypothetical protein